MSVERIGVFPDHRRKRVGTKLIAYVRCSNARRNLITDPTYAAMPGYFASVRIGFSGPVEGDGPQWFPNAAQFSHALLVTSGPCAALPERRNSRTFRGHRRLAEWMLSTETRWESASNTARCAPPDG